MMNRAQKTPHAPLSLVQLPKKLFILFVLLILSGTVSHPSRSSASDQQQKKESQQESFTIDGTTYVIPEPWTGNRIDAPSPAAMVFGQVPVENTVNGSHVYVEKTTLQALKQMMEAAEMDNIHLVVVSGFRSYQYQKKIFTRMLNNGRTFDDIIRYVAPPGYSQHALGIAVDFHPSNWRFADYPAYEWLKENGSIFGFTETYSDTNSLGYPWESWHWAYTPDEQENQ